MTVRRPHFRFRVRSLLLAVALLAVIAWFGIMARRTRQFSKLAQEHRNQFELYAAAERRLDEEFAELAKIERRIAELERAETPHERDFALTLRRGVAVMKEKITMDEQHFSFGAMRRHYEFLAAKYQLAASRSWFTVKPDPPRPARRKSSQ